MSDDIVAELDRWLRSGHLNSQELVYQIMERARDEIAELRRYWNGKGRAEVLEEAAQKLERLATYYHRSDVTREICRECAAAVRLLKDKP